MPPTPLSPPSVGAFFVRGGIWGVPMQFLPFSSLVWAFQSPASDFRSQALIFQSQALENRSQGLNSAEGLKNQTLQPLFF